MAHVVRQEDEVFRGVKQLAGAEHNAAEIRREKLPAGAASAVQDEHRIADLAAGILLRRAQRVVMQLHLGQLFSGLELKVFYHERSGLRRGIVGGAKRQSCKADEQDRKIAAELHG